MALYEYECMPNGHRFEVMHGMNESPVRYCSQCKGDVRRVITAAGLVFKGSGFYVTDSRKTSEATSEGKPTSASGKPQAEAVSAKTPVPSTGGDTKAAMGHDPGPRSG